MPLTIKPPRPPPEQASSPYTQQRPISASAPPTQQVRSQPGSSSPIAPEFSPITPKVQPALPTFTTAHNDSSIYRPADTTGQEQQGSAIAPSAQYMPEPPPQHFSLYNSTDAIALRAAISTLQLQKQKARDDLRALDAIKQQAVADPEHFRKELAAGRLKERRPDVESLQAILDAPDSDDEENGESVLGASTQARQDVMMPGFPEEVPDSQPSRPTTSSSALPHTQQLHDPPPFAPIPGPQNVVRMPFINWDKYHIVGKPLDVMHEQQRLWPGSTTYGQDRGREHLVAAPYSPWLDGPERKQEVGAEAQSNDSVNTPAPVVTSSVSEHPMETRRSSKNQ